MGRCSMFLAVAALVGSLSGARAAQLRDEKLYSAKIVDVTNIAKIGREDAINATLVLDTEIPNDNATVVIRAVSGKKPNWILEVFTATDVPTGKPTKHIDVQFSPSKADVKVAQLKNRVLNLYSHRYDVKLVDVKDRGAVGERDFHNADIVLDSYLPNEDATLVIELDGKPLRLWVMSSTELPGGEATKTLSIQVKKSLIERLKNQAARLYSPPLPSTK